MKIRLGIVAGFAGAIFLGFLAFFLPISNPTGEWRAPMDALFTACSAVCITGLTVIDPSSELTTFGQIVLTALVQLGCVGISTAGTFLLVCAGRRLSLANEVSLSGEYGMVGVKDLRAIVVGVVLSMFVFEGLGTLALRACFGEGRWFEAYFYSVMSFCNAGFSIHPGSLAEFRDNASALFVLGSLVVVGGLGFCVLWNVVTIRFWRRSLLRQGRISLHSRVVVYSSLGFLLFTFATFCLFEWRGALASYSGWNRAAVAFFQCVTPRTCGFTVVPVEAWHPAMRFISEVLMFVGAAPGSAGGGIKITTFVVFLFTLRAICRGGGEVLIGHRTVPEVVVRRAIVIVFVFAALVACATTALLVTEAGSRLTFEQLFYEAISAVSTTGLSMGDTTESLSTASRWVLMACMFLGRLGALTVVLLISGEEAPHKVRYPKEALLVG